MSADEPPEATAPVNVDASAFALSLAFESVSVVSPATDAGVVNGLPREVGSPVDLEEGEVVDGVEEE